MAATTAKSVITCDLEGRIETFNPGAEQMFGYAADEVVGKKRVSLFSPGLVVLEHVPRWLAEASETGQHESDTVFVRKDGSEFPARIRITPTKKDGEQIGFCGVTEPLPPEQLEAARPPISPGTRLFRWLVIMRAPFLTATIVPVLAGAALAAYASAGAFPWLAFALTLVGACALHVAANTFNDYYDWTSGTDQANADYFLPFSGGSRSLELRLIDLPGLKRVAWTALSIGAACGAALLAWVGPELLAFGAVGAFAAIFYTAPPIRLVARKGLGELFVGLCFGPLMTGGTYFALTGELTAAALFIGLPIGLLTTAILWINEFPDAPSDATTGKNHLVVVMGKKAARWGYAALLVASAALVGLGVALELLPALTLIALASAPIGIYATKILFEHYEDRSLVRANKATIQLQLVAGLLIALGVFLAG